MAQCFLDKSFDIDDNNAILEQAKSSPKVIDFETRFKNNSSQYIYIYIYVYIFF